MRGGDGGCVGFDLDVEGAEMGYGGEEGAFGRGEDREMMMLLLLVLVWLSGESF
jgi:hypothetical protein